MRIQHAALAATLVLALGGAVRADDIVYFTNGTAMPVRSHKVEKGMIRVDLGNNAAMAFPVSMVEKVESAGRNVFPNGGAPANQAVAGGAPSTMVTGAATVPSQYRRRDDPEQQLAQAQARAQNPAASLHHPPANANTAAKRNLRVVAGGTPTVNEDGTFRRGNVSVMASPGAPVGSQSGDESKPIITSFGPSTAVPAEPVVEEGSNDGDGDGDNPADPDAGDPPDER